MAKSCRQYRNIDGFCEFSEFSDCSTRVLIFLGHRGIGSNQRYHDISAVSEFLSGYVNTLGLAWHAAIWTPDKKVRAIRSIKLAYYSVYCASSIVHFYLLADCYRSSRRLLPQGLAVAQFTARRKEARVVSSHWEVFQRRPPLSRTYSRLTAPLHRRHHPPNVLRGRRGRRVVHRRRQSHNGRTTVRSLVSHRPPATNELRSRAFFRWPNPATDGGQGRHAAPAGRALQAHMSTDCSGSRIVWRWSEASRSPTTSLRSRRPVMLTAMTRPPPTTRTPLRHLQASNVLLWPRLLLLPTFTSPTLKMIWSPSLWFDRLVCFMLQCKILNTKLVT